MIEGNTAALLGPVSAGGATLLLLLAVVGLCIPGPGQHRAPRLLPPRRRVRSRMLSRWQGARTAPTWTATRAGVTTDGLLTTLWCAGSAVTAFLLGLLLTSRR